MSTSPFDMAVRTETAASSNKNEGSGWAMTVSDYLMSRRMQTMHAYQRQRTGSVSTTDTLSDIAKAEQGVFSALFALLVQRLEEGHTVLTIAAGSAWQQMLLEAMVRPLIDCLPPIADTPDSDNVPLTLDAFLREDKHWQAALWQLAMPSYQKDTLTARYHSSAALYQVFKQINQNNSHQNSLSNFLTIIKNSSFIQTDEEKDSSENSPIIYRWQDNPQTLTLWLHRAWQAEHDLVQHILRIKSQNVQPLDILPNTLLNTEQQSAIDMANRSALSIITGGPGTGKTFTVAQLVMALQSGQYDDNTLSNTPNLALSAPTGKAAQRMQESLQAAIEQAGIDMQLPEAKTIHRLLGIGQGGRARYNQSNPLGEDIIIVDEASMLGVELAKDLVSAVKAGARLILLGDANQLAAVDAGAVLADLCRVPQLQDVHQALSISRRFDAQSGVGQLARFINTPQKDSQGVWQIIDQHDSLEFYTLYQGIYNKNSLSKIKFLKLISSKYSKYFKKTKNIKLKNSSTKSIPTSEAFNFASQLMNVLSEYKVLTAGHHGVCGDHNINQYLTQQHKEVLQLPLSKSEWYHGRPVMVLQNNYELGLFNGDIGVCLETERGRLQVFFEGRAQGIAVNMMSEDMVTTAYAMTIHKSQGSEFEHVAIAFDDQHTRLLSQELIYTAVTRAKKQVSIFSTLSAFEYALSTPTIRQTGLSLQFQGEG
ncbi:exodeoxyribonuclease V subunit alpha [Psychrobacter aestuarii]|uniref:RecBCD enzyme subunit RecD n=1 Tax=Psychrobacter aestuarii TaxID=556327 RepID=A0ABN0VQX5_9GAMM|nr:exodeoxyribonuclease V subunit alpha [Psychrobacter aestuarii]